jgi:hypothetical protein
MTRWIGPDRNSPGCRPGGQSRLTGHGPNPSGPRATGDVIPHRSSRAPDTRRASRAHWHGSFRRTERGWEANILGFVAVTEPHYCGDRTTLLWRSNPWPKPRRPGLAGPAFPGRACRTRGLRSCVACPSPRRDAANACSPRPPPCLGWPPADHRSASRHRTAHVSVVADAYSDSDRIRRPRRRWPG